MDEPQGLTVEQKSDLIKEIDQFKKWLIKKEIAKSIWRPTKAIDFPFTNADWVMQVDMKNNVISFNTFVANSTTFDFYKLIVLHEYFHLAVQRLPNKEDSTRVKDDFGDDFMKLIDIESDYYTALYYKEKLSYSLVKFMSLNFESNKIFGSKKIRAIKLERFIGSLLSVVNMYENNKKPNKGLPVCDLYLPTIRAIYTEESLHILVIKKEHIYCEEIKASYTDFVNIKRCHTNTDEITKKGFVSETLRFAYKALQKDMPEHIINEIDGIN